MNSSFSNSETQFIRINDVQIAYRHFGEEFPILFYNRFRGILDTWDPLFLDSLASEHTIVLFDYPGIGDSEASISRINCRIHQFIS